MDNLDYSDISPINLLYLGSIRNMRGWKTQANDVIVGQNFKFNYNFKQLQSFQNSIWSRAKLARILTISLKIFNRSI